MEHGFAAKLLDILYPRKCPVCHDVVLPKGKLICPECYGHLSFVKEPVCKMCGKEILAAEAEYCYDCTKKTHSFTKSLSLLNYDAAARSSIVKFKYSGRREYADFYMEELIRRYGRTIRGWKIDAIIPVPIHKSRLQTRGFNQAEDLAKRLGKALDIPVGCSLLLRNKKTTAQKELNLGQRQKNLEKALSVNSSVCQYPRILLVDDIYTTGSTLEACTRVLRQAGVQRVYAVTVCIGRNT